MACPYFYPTGRIDARLWPHPSRLPLGGGFRGLCYARAGELVSPDQASLRDCCNLGYAGGQCERFPPEAPADAVRFSLAGDDDGIVTICYAREKDHLPFDHGTVRFDSRKRVMLSAIADSPLGRQIES